MTFDLYSGYYQSVLEQIVIIRAMWERGTCLFKEVSNEFQVGIWSTGVTVESSG